MTDPVSPAPRGPTLRLVCINDVYSLEHLPRFKSLVRHFTETAPADALLVTLAGDFVAPSMLSSLDKGRGMVDCLNAVPVTHVIFGNHEDDIGDVELRKRVAEFRGIWLNTNVPGFTPPLPAHQVITVAAPGGRAVRVGLVGVVMGDASVYRHPPFGGTTIVPANASAMAEAARLMEVEHCACVIPLTHQTLADDGALARAQRNPPFPLIVGGHEHEPMLVEIEGTHIVKAGSEATSAVIVDLAWPALAPPAGIADLPAVSAKLWPVDGYPEDPSLRARVDANMSAVHELEHAALLQLPEGAVLSSVGTRARQTTLGTLLCTILRRALGAEGAVINGGGIRAARDYHGEFTYGDLKAELPFDNEVVVARLPGRVLREAIAASRARAPAEFGGFLQVDDGMKVTAPGNALVSVAGAPLDDEREYAVALMRNLLTGMDHVEPLVRFAEAHPDKVPPEGCGRDIKLVLVDAFAVALWRELGEFDAIDQDRDGLVSAAELAAAVARTRHAPPSPLVVDLVLRALDADHDRAISRGEAQSALTPQGSKRGC